MKRSILLAALPSMVAGFATTADLQGQSLRGGSSSLELQNRIAREHNFTYIDTPERAHYFRDRGWLVTVRPSPDLVLHQVSFPMARPEVNLFVERLSRQYRSACGEQLVVTSLTRPKSRQPRNASDRSVHPTGMAVDLRRPNNHTCRTWLQRVLLDLEAKGVLEATLERYPPHYHLAVFPTQYAGYVAELQRRAEEAGGDGSEFAEFTYVVRRGDTLWGIAREHNTTVEEIRRLNYLKSNRIDAGQSLAIPRVAR